MNPLGKSEGPHDKDFIRSKMFQTSHFWIQNSCWRTYSIFPIPFISRMRTRVHFFLNSILATSRDSQGQFRCSMFLVGKACKPQHTEASWWHCRSFQQSSRTSKQESATMLIAVAKEFARTTVPLNLVRPAKQWHQLDCSRCLLDTFRKSLQKLLPFRHSMCQHCKVRTSHHCSKCLQHKAGKGLLAQVAPDLPHNGLMALQQHDVVKASNLHPLLHRKRRLMRTPSQAPTRPTWRTLRLQMEKENVKVLFPPTSVEPHPSEVRFFATSDWGCCESILKHDVDVLLSLK